MLQVNKTLTHIDFSGNRNFSDSGAHCIFQRLQQNTSLVHLNLSNTGLVAADHTAQALTTMLQVNKTIKYLDVSVNCWIFSDAGAYRVFQGLQQNTSLVHLNLSDTGLVANKDTAQALTKMLQINKTLAHLNLSRNQTFSRSYSCAVFQGLEHNTALVHLNLRCTGLVELVRYTVEALDYNAPESTRNSFTPRYIDVCKSEFLLTQKHCSECLNSILCSYKSCAS